MAINFKQLQDTLTTNHVDTSHKDVIGGTRDVLESNIYNATVVDAFSIVSARGSMGLTITLKIEGVDQEYNETIYFTSSKTNAPFYVDQNTGERRPLPGWLLVDEFAKLTTDHSIAECTTSEKQAKVWENGEQVVRTVDALDGCLNSPIKVAIQKVEQNRFANGATTDEKITVNVINKFLSSDGRTVYEIENNKPASFYKQWLDKNMGKTINKYKPVAPVAVQGFNSFNANPTNSTSNIPNPFVSGNVVPF